MPGCSSVGCRSVGLRSVGSAAGAGLPPGLAALYLCADGPSGTLVDSSGSGRNGTLGAAGAAPTWGATGLVFDGAADYVDCGVIPYSPAGLSVFVVTLGAEGTDTVIAGRYDTGLNARCWQLSPVSGKFAATVSADGTLTASTAKTYVSTATAFGDGKYHCIGFVFDAGTLSIYCDGVPDTPSVKTRDATMATIYDPAAVATTLGCRLNSGAPAGHFAGTEAAVVVCPYALTAWQAARLTERLWTLLAPRGVADPL